MTEMPDTHEQEWARYQEAWRSYQAAHDEADAMARVIADYAADGVPTHPATLRDYQTLRSAESEARRVWQDAHAAHTRAVSS